MNAQNTSPAHMLKRGGVIMGRFRKPDCGGGARRIGILMMAVGAALMIWLVPARLWGAALGFAFLVAGFLIYRFGG